MICRTHAALTLLLAVGAMPGAAGTPACPECTLRIEPSRVPVDLFYSGTTVRVSARIPAGYDAAVRLTSGAERLELKQVGKVAGLLWMSVGDVVFGDVPVLYHLLTTAPLDTLAPPADLAQWKLGYAALVRADHADARFMPELIRLKERDGLWATHEGGLTSRADGAAVQVDGAFVLPAAVSPGEYTVDVIGFSNQRASRLIHETVVIERVGAVGVVWSLAMEHRLLYGCAAVVTAIVAGLLTGLLFQSRRHKAR